MIIIIFWDPFDALFFNIFSRNKRNPDKNTNLPSSLGTFPNHLALANQGPILEIRSLQNHHNVSIICVSTQKPYQRAHLSAIFTKKRAHFLLLHNSSSRAPLPENAIQRLLHQMCPNLDPYPFLGLGVFWILVEDFAEASIGAREIEREWVICVKI